MNTSNTSIVKESRLQDVVIKELANGYFVPGVDDAYSWILGGLGLGGDRIGQYFTQQLKALDWDMIGKTVAGLKAELISR